MTGTKSNTESKNTQDQIQSELKMSCRPDQLADSLIDSLFVQNTKDILHNDYSFSWQTAVKLLLLLSMGEFKNIVTRILAGVIPTIKKSPVLFIGLYTQILRIHSWLLERSFIKSRIKGSTNTAGEKIENHLVENIKPSDHILRIHASQHFVASLYHYLINNPKCTFDSHTSSIDVNNLKDRTVKKIIKHISIGDISVSNTLFYDINVMTNEPISSKIINISESVNEPKSYTDLFTDEQRAILITCMDKIKIVCDYKNISQRLQKNKSDSYNEFTFADIIVSAYPQFDFSETYLCICVLFSIYWVINDVWPGYTCAKSINQGIRTFLDPKRTHQSIISGEYTSSFLKYRPELFNYYSKEDYVKVFDELFKYNCNEESKKKVLNKENTDELVFRVSHEVPKDQVQIKVLDIIDEICKYQRSEQTTKIKIYNLILQINKDTQSQTNPEYEQWMEQKRILDEYKELLSMRKNSDRNIDSTKIINSTENQNEMSAMDSNSWTAADNTYSEVLGNFCVQVPPKNIITEKITRTIVTELINETFKSIDTLYLREKDMDQLFTSLDQFRNKKHILKDLGLPNKLNVLLYGEPGTGKSTAIQAIATYLRRDIYYLDLKNVQTNRDLQMIFEYVNKNVQNGGIIVIEDIDAMTDLVLKREECLELRVNQLTNSADCELSLEYMLNVLQGTLTLDDSIFIVTTNHIEHLDPAFYRDGRFDVKIKLRKCDHYQFQTIYRKFLNREIPSDLLENIIEDHFSPATVIFHVKNYVFKTDVADSDILARFLTKSDE